MPEVSVIVPLYNKGRYVQRALSSILRQEFSDFEVIVVDDGSTDDGPDVVMQQKDARVRLLRQSNQGPGAARNAGLHICRGALVAFLDADDEWLPTYLMQAVSALRLAGNDVATHTCTYLEEPGGTDSSGLWRQRGFQPGVYRLSPQDTSTVLLHRVAFMSPCTTVVRAEVAKSLGGFYAADGCRYAEDAHLWLRAILTCRVSFQIEPHVRIHRDASDLSATTRVARPLEPFLAHPEDIRALCPADLGKLLEEFLAIRAFKTACAWSYWGQWRAARELMQRFAVAGQQKLPFYWAARFAATPLGAAIGRLARLPTRMRG